MPIRKNFIIKSFYFLLVIIFTFSCSKNEENKSDDKKIPPKAENSDEEKKNDEPVTNKYNFFETTISKTSSKTEEIKLFGKVKSVNSYSVVPAIQGQVTKLMVSNGSNVSAGQVIAYIDDKVLKSEIDQLQADYKLAISEIKRSKELYDSAKKLFETGLMPKQDYDNAFYNFEQAKIKADSAKSKILALNTQLSYSKVIVQNSGNIYNLQPVGSMAGPGMAPLAIINSPPSEIEFNIPFNANLKAGNSLFIDNKEYKINSIYSDPANNNRIANVKISGNNFENLQPINAVFKKIIKGIEVPQTSVISYKGNPVIFSVIRENDSCNVITLSVKIIYSDNTSYLVSGIKENTKIISKGAEILEDKEKIECGK